MMNRPRYIEEFLCGRVHPSSLPYHETVGTTADREWAGNCHHLAILDSDIRELMTEDLGIEFSDLIQDFTQLVGGER